MTQPKHGRQRHETTSARGPHRVPGRHDGARQPPPGTPDMRIRRPAREEREQVRAERDPRSATRKTRATKPAPRTPGIKRQDSIVNVPATRGEHLARSRRKRQERRADGTSGGRGNRRGRALRSSAASTPTGHRDRDRGPVQRKHQEHLAQRGTRRAEAPTTPSADRGRKGDQYRQQHPAPGRRPEVEHFRTTPER